MRFSAVPGLSEEKSMLLEAASSNHIAHAQLFVGADGALNLPLALAFATYIHCESRRADDSCGVCAACSKNDKFIHPDTHFVYPSNLTAKEKKDNDDDNDKEQSPKVEMLKSWRSFLTEQPFGNLDDWTTYYGGEDKQAIISRDASRDIIKSLALKPFESKYKVMIIWQPELMHQSAANGILKILEEPSPNTFLILVTNAADKLLPTILSRTQIVTIPLLKDEEVAQTLIDKYEADPGRAAKMAQLAEGNINQAVKLLDSVDDINFPRFREWMLACWQKSYGALVTMAENYHALDKLSQKNIMAHGMNMMRESLLSVSGSSDMNRTRGEELQFVQKFSKVMDLEKIEKSYTLMNDASFHLERNGSAKMIFLDLSLKLSRTINP